MKQRHIAHGPVGAGPDRSPGEPLYLWVARRIGDLIDRGELPVDEPLPSEPELSEMLGVGRSTVREAILQLQIDGRVARSRGRRSVVLSVSPIVQGLNSLESFEALAARQGWSCDTIHLEMTQVGLHAASALALELDEGEPATRIRRVKTRDGRSVALMETWVPRSIIDMSRLRSSFGTSITEFFASNAEHRLAYSVASIDVVSADQEMAKLLGVERESPLVALYETFFTHAGAPLCWSRNLHTPAAVSLTIVRRVRT